MLQQVSIDQITIYKDMHVNFLCKNMSRNMRKCAFGANANSKDPDQPVEIYSLIRNYNT